MYQPLRDQPFRDQPLRILSISALSGVVLLLQACASPGLVSSQVLPIYDPVQLASAHPFYGMPNQLDNLNEGDSATFTNGSLSRLGQVSIGREYYSASGRLCKKILNASGDLLVGVACKLDDQQWYTRQGS